MKYLLLLLYVISGAFGMVLVKLGGAESQFSFSKGKLSIETGYFFLIGLILYVISFIVWMIILQKFELTFISPLAYGLLFIALALVSWIFLGETLDLYKIIGIILIISGALTMTVFKK